MSQMSNVCIRIDSEIKAKAEILFAELGLNISTAFNIFIRKAVREGGIPFSVSLEKPNAETRAAMLEAEYIAKDSTVKGFNDIDELFQELDQ